LIKHPDKSKGRNIASLIKSGNSKKKIFVTISEVEEREKNYCNNIRSGIEKKKTMCNNIRSGILSIKRP
jgi:hypothetical protein